MLYNNYILCSNAMVSFKVGYSYWRLLKTAVVFELILGLQLIYPCFSNVLL